MITVIGDIHGCFNTLEKLIEKISVKYADIPLYCVGDLVDRGNFSYEVMEYFAEHKIPFTPGNHDFMFYYYMKEPSSVMGRAWHHNGSETTLRSYQGRWEKVNAHLEMVKEAPLFINHKDCFISHAGISTYYKSKFKDDVLGDNELLEKIFRNDLIEEHGLLWTRDKLINIGKLQIVGHTRFAEPKHDLLNNVLYIDTAAVANNKLSAAIVDENKIVEIISQETIPIDTTHTSF